MSRIDAPLQPPSQFDPGRGAGASADGRTGMQGRMDNQRVVVDTGQSVLTDAAEEISLHHAEKAEAKHSAERKKELTRPMELMNAEAIENYVNAAEPDQTPQHLKDLAKKLLSGQGDPLQLARQAMRQPTSQYLALQYALGQGEREGASDDVLERLREALEDQEMSHGPRIRADVNTVATASEGKATAADVVDFQQTYVDVVMGEATLNQTLLLALDRFGENELAAGLARLTRALGQDLAAARPSADPTRLQNLVQDLYHLGVATTVLEGCQSLLADLRARHACAPDQGAVELMKDLVGISVENWLSPSRFTQLSEKFGAAEVAPQIVFVGGVKDLLHGMPPKVFVDGEQRFSVFQAVQQALDAAIDREEY